MSSTKPNIILIITDDQGYGDLACHGNTFLHTPNINRFYAQSTRFTSFQVSPTCAPTRASLMTGRHEFRCGITHVKKGRSILNSNNVTLAEVLAHAGYRTGIFGKWHLGSNYPSRPEDRGFSETCYFGGSHLGCTGDYWGNSKFSPVVKHNGKFEKIEGYSTDVFFNQALKWIQKDVEDPFFAYIATCVPHHPYQAPDEYKQIYEDKGLEEKVSHFYGMISKLDDAFGSFISQIDEFVKSPISGHCEVLSVYSIQ